MPTPARWSGLRPRRRRTSPPLVEDLEARVVLSGGLPPIFMPIQVHDPNPLPPDVPHANNGTTRLDFGSPGPIGYTPAQVAAAYGLNNIVFGSIAGDGAGQTIAIVDAYDDPAFVNSTDPNFSTSDLAKFDKQFGLPDPPSFTKYGQDGSTSKLAGTDPAGAGNLNGTWEMEESLDIEWAHAMAPGASIVLVEANSDTNNDDIFQAVRTAASLPGVSVVSMSWGLPEYDGQQSVDATYTTPGGHQGVTFIASSGDSGSPGYYPAYSPNVLATGGTTLTLGPHGTVLSETAWSGSGGGTSQYEPEPAYQQGYQSTGSRTMPDVSWVADPNTGVAIYDSWDSTDSMGDWYELGGTSVAAPCWSGLIAIADQGRALEGIDTLDGPTQTLPAIYYAPASDFVDITKGSNGGFQAGPGYDQVTGRGSPVSPHLISDLVSFGAASKLAITAQPPSQVIAGDSFGVVVSAESPGGEVDPSFNGQVTLTIGNDPTGATFDSVTVQAVRGVAVFDGLTLDQVGSGYTLTIGSTSFASVTTAPFAIVADPHPGTGTYFPVPTDASLRAAIHAADSNGYTDNTIVLSASTYVLTDTALGQIVIQNEEAPLSGPVHDKTLTIVGQGPGSTIIRPGTFPWQDRIFEVLGTSVHITVVFRDLTISGGEATGGGVLGGNEALGGGVLIDGGTVVMSDVAVQGNRAVGADGAAGKVGNVSAPPTAGGAGHSARGGGIYLATGALILNHSTITGNRAAGGAGGAGGAAEQVAGGTKVSNGGAGGAGASAFGGGLYVAGGTVSGSNDAFASDTAVGGAGGMGGKGGLGGLGGAGGVGGAGGAGGAAYGGGIYLGAGSITLGSARIVGDRAVGGYGGAGGSGGPGSSLVATSNISFPGFTLTPSGSVGIPTGSSLLSGSFLSKLFKGGPGGDGGVGGPGGAGFGGGVYVGGGSLTLSGTSLGDVGPHGGDQAVGGQGGTGGRGGQAGMAALIAGIGGGGSGFSFSSGSGLGHTGGGGTGAPAPLGGHGGKGGAGGDGNGGGLYLAAGTVTLWNSTVANDDALGGQGGTGGIGGAGAFAGGLSGLGFTSKVASSVAGHSFLGGSRHHARHQTSGGLSSNVGGFATGGDGGDGGAGGLATGGGVYVGGGSLTLQQDTVASNSVAGGPGGSAGPGGPGGSFGKGNGQSGISGSSGSGSAAGFYVGSGSVRFFNSTVALNSVSGIGLVAGVLQIGGTVEAVSTLFAGDTRVGPSASPVAAYDYSGALTATDSLIQSPANPDTITGSGNLIGVDAMLADSLADNGGPTRTVALQAGSPALGAGSNPENFLTDQRGYGPRTDKSGKTDIGALESSAVSDTTAPIATLTAPGVTSSDAPSTYQFNVTYADNLSIAVASLDGAVVQVAPPGGGAPITAALVSTTAVGPTDPAGNAASFQVTYEFTPPDGSWSADENGTYTVILAGTPVTDMAGNTVAKGTLGTFDVDIPSANQLVITASPPGSTPLKAGTIFTVKVAIEDQGGHVQTGYSGTVDVALVSGPEGTTLLGTKTVSVVGGFATFDDLELDRAATGYALRATSSGLPAVETGTFDMDPASASQVVITAQPSTTVNVGQAIGFTATVEDRYNNVVTGYGGDVTASIGANPGGGSLGGTTTEPASQGVATFSDLTIDQAGDGYTLRADASGLTSATTDSFDVSTGSGGQTTRSAPTQLAITAAPTGWKTAGTAFFVRVALEDAQGQVQTGSGGTVTIAIASGPSGAKLLGTTTVPVNQGVATFGDLAIDQASLGYTLRVSRSGLPSSTTGAFGVSPASASHLVVIDPPPSSVGTGQGFGLTIAAEDDYGNVATDASGTATITLPAGVNGAGLAGTATVSFHQGVAAFANLSINQSATGTDALQVTASGLAAITAGTVNVTVPTSTPPPPGEGQDTGTSSGGSTGGPTDNPPPGGTVTTPTSTGTGRGARKGHRAKGNHAGLGHKPANPGHHRPKPHHGKSKAHHVRIARHHPGPRAHLTMLAGHHQNPPHAQAEAAGLGLHHARHDIRLHPLLRRKLS